MACKRCGGSRKVKMINLPIYEVIDQGGVPLKISTKSTILLQGLERGELRFNVGKIIKVSATAAANLLTQGAPIWILT